MRQEVTANPVLGNNKSPVFGRTFSTYLMCAFCVANSLPDTVDEVVSELGASTEYSHFLPIISSVCYLQHCLTKTTFSSLAFVPLRGNKNDSDVNNAGSPRGL